MARWMLSLTLLVLPVAVTSFALAGDIQRTPPENDTCEHAIEIYGGGGCGYSFQGTTRDATNDYDPYDPGSGESCVQRSALGPDVVYKAYLGSCGADLLYVVLGVIGEWDAVMYIISDCADPAASCLAAGDGANPIEFYAPVEGWYYLVIDSFSGSGDFWGYSIQGVVGSWATAAGPSSWGSVKSLYR